MLPKEIKGVPHFHVPRTLFLNTLESYKRLLRQSVIAGRSQSLTISLFHKHNSFSLSFRVEGTSRFVPFALFTTHTQAVSIHSRSAVIFGEKATEAPWWPLGSTAARRISAGGVAGQGLLHLDACAGVALHQLLHVLLLLALQDAQEVVQLRHTEGVPLQRHKNRVKETGPPGGLFATMQQPAAVFDLAFL